MSDANLQVVANFCQSVPKVIVSKIVTGLKDGLSLAAIANQTGLNTQLIHDLTTLANLPYSREELAAMLELGALLTEQEKETRLYLVWSGPSAYLEARKTEQVMLEIIQAATKELWLVSFAAYRCPAILTALEAARMRKVSISLVLENEHDSSGQLTNCGCAK